MLNCKLCNNILKDLVVTESQVLNALNNLDTSKATGPDGLSARMLKVCAYEIAPSLCKIFNISLSQGVSPEDWRVANVTPLYKKGSHNDTSNYRPVSITSLVYKVLERIIYNYILVF